MAMAVYVVRAGNMGAGEESAISDGLYAIDFGLHQSVNNFDDRNALRDHLQQTWSVSIHKAAMSASQVWRFVHDIGIADLVVLPRKQTKVVAVGRMAGEYTYRPDDELIGPHTRVVEWRAIDIPRANFDTDLLHSLGANPTIFQVRAANAEERINGIVNAYLNDSPIPDSPPISIIDDDDSTATDLDLDEYIADRIVERIRQKFSGHRLEYMVASILKAEGYTALQTRPGPDGGVDVVAGKGDMGFGEPRLCVQVKSSRAAVDLPDYNRLQGNVQSFGADHGLLVGLGDFTRAVRNENERSFFQIRLWGPYELAQRLIDNYDDLPLDIRTDIPLQSRRVLVESDD